MSKSLSAAFNTRRHQTVEMSPFETKVILW